MGESAEKSECRCKIPWKAASIDSFSFCAYTHFVQWINIPPHRTSVEDRVLGSSYWPAIKLRKLAIFSWPIFNFVVSLGSVSLLNNRA